MKMLFFLLLFCSFFVFNVTCSESEDQVVINEIAWMGGSNSSSDEWIELKNLDSQEINLEGWTLVAADGTPSIILSGSISASGFFLLERTDDESVPGVVADQIYSGALGNDGELLELYDGEGILIDLVDMSAGWSAGDNDSKQSMERREDGSWQNSLESGGTPREANSEGEAEAIEDDSNEEANSEETADSSDTETTEDEPTSAEATADEGGIEIFFSLGDVVINEFVSDPADGEVEWIELYNNTGEEIALDDWSVEEGSGAKTSLEGSLDKYFVIESPKGNLNNGGDEIILRDGQGNLIDRIVYGDWDDGDLTNNAPVASDPYSVARKFDGENSYNNFNDFSVTTNLTKNQANIIINPDEDELSEEDYKNYDYSDDIVITEIFPNPEGSDSEAEFFELFNQGDKDVDLLGWRFGDGSKKRFEIKEEKIISAQSYLVIYRLESKLALNNTSDSLKIFQPLQDECSLEIEYEGALEAWSYAIDMEGNWFWSEVVTAGEINIIETINHPPTVDFYFPDEIYVGEPTVFDSSDTIDDDNDDLDFFWDFGDGIELNLPSPEHTYFNSGAYVIKLKVSDGENETEAEKEIVVLAPVEDEEKISSGSKSEKEETIVINEFLPNPEGDDKIGEWIELKNLGETEVNLLHWSVDDIEGGSSPYEFDSDVWLDVDDLFLLNRSESKLALNNSFDAVRLFNGDNELIEQVDYGETIENNSYARGLNNKFFWTEKLTPGQENIISLASSDFDLTEGNVIITIPKTEGQIINATLDKIDEFESGDLIKVKGVVAVLPGSLGTQYFYIIPATEAETVVIASSISEVDNNTGLQIYNYKKDFPNLVLGDYIEVSGELSVVQDEFRLKTKTKEDMNVISHGEEPVALNIACDNINADIIGALLRVSGEVVERKSSLVYLDDGTDETLVYVKTSTGINVKEIEEGDIISVSGILGKTESGLRIMPRSSEDIVKKDVESRDVEIGGQVLGEAIADLEWSIEQRDKKLELFKYLLIVAGGVIFVLIGVLVWV